MTKRIIKEKNGNYYRLIAAHFNNNKELIRVEEIVEGKVLKEIKGVLFELLPDWKNIKIEGE
jgi:hypothetical protein